jgi:hypothetical protein
MRNSSGLVLCERKLARTLAHVGAMSSMGVCSKGAISAMLGCVMFVVENQGEIDEGARAVEVDSRAKETPMVGYKA